MGKSGSACGAVAAIATLAVGLPSFGHAALTFYDTQAAFNGAATTTLLENFSSPALMRDSPLPSLTHNGVTYTGLAGAPFPNVFVASPGYTNFGAAVGTTTEFILTANGDENINADFSTPYRAVGFSAYFNGLGDGTLTVFGAGHAVLGALTFTGGFDPATGLADKGYLGFTSSAPVYGFNWDTTAGGVLNTGFSDISVATVPEPATWAMMMIGFGVLGLVVRRKRAALASA